jgi:hypothetical protein
MVIDAGDEILVLAEDDSMPLPLVCLYLYLKAAYTRNLSLHTLVKVVLAEDDSTPLPEGPGRYARNARPHTPIAEGPLDTIGGEGCARSWLKAR